MLISKLKRVGSFLISRHIFVTIAVAGGGAELGAEDSPSSQLRPGAATKREFWERSQTMARAVPRNQGIRPSVCTVYSCEGSEQDVSARKVTYGKLV